ncbi:MAG: hypothetical protein IJX67_09045 [Oscillospiraceae bacterium]|nr:hypothetical protein [Oscillospiraceae bacterium]
MKNIVFYSAGISPALSAACAWLTASGYTVAKSPDESVTHLLLPVPSLEPDGRLKGGEALESVLAQLPEHVAVFGGNLNTPLLANYLTVDFLKDEPYLCENAAITADCAIRIIRNNLPRAIKGTTILIIGWGRIGKHLARMLQNLGADVTVAARKASDRGMLDSLGFHTELPENLNGNLTGYQVIINTAPELIITDSPNCLKIDLASSKGIAGDDVIWARGLPGKDAPESSGELIANTAIRYANYKEEL